MPITFALSIVVKIQLGLMRSEILSVSRQSASDAKNNLSIAGSERREGEVQRVDAKSSRSSA